MTYLLGKPGKRVKMSPNLKKALKVSARQGRRETVYRMLKKRQAGHVPCALCGALVSEKEAALTDFDAKSMACESVDGFVIIHKACPGNCSVPS
ncbi:DNA gyrase subunit A [Novimethylophilus kurashikiensis]|uniref:DNA gyrase subunit A n=1 Tax=Novimethylophilus kurashikiensis TaxID=1825523 RepID=A0A2R5FBN3_9PROT|nr:DNA gyrase subunit A [Novimethylophilus kurashikiensis]